MIDLDFKIKKLEVLTLLLPTIISHCHDRYLCFYLTYIGVSLGCNEVSLITLLRDNSEVLKCYLSSIIGQLFNSVLSQVSHSTYL